MTVSQSERAYQAIRRMIVRLELAPGAVLREESLQLQLGTGRTPIREALQRLVRDQFVTVLPRRGMYVSSIDVSELSMLYETRAILEPYATRLACARGRPDHWSAMAAALARAERARLDTGGTDRDRPRVPRDRLGGRRQPVPDRHPRHALRPERPPLAHVPGRGRRHGRRGGRARRDPRGAGRGRCRSRRRRWSKRTFAPSTSRCGPPSSAGSSPRSPTPASLVSRSIVFT